MIMLVCRGLVSGVVDDHEQPCARIYADNQRFGNFGAEVPEIRGAVPFLPRRSKLAISPWRGRRRPAARPAPLRQPPVEPPANGLHSALQLDRGDRSNHPIFLSKSDQDHPAHPRQDSRSDQGRSGDELFGHLLSLIISRHETIDQYFVEKSACPLGSGIWPDSTGLRRGLSRVVTRPHCESLFGRETYGPSCVVLGLGD
jgi:hypothetical protein